MPALCDALRKATYDPRISGVLLELDGLGAGWGKVQVRAVGGRRS